MSDKKEVKREIDWGAFWEDPSFLSEEEIEEFWKLFRVDRNDPDLHKTFGPVDGGGNWEKAR